MHRRCPRLFKTIALSRTENTRSATTEDTPDRPHACSMKAVPADRLSHQLLLQAIRDDDAPAVTATCFGFPDPLPSPCVTKICDTGNDRKKHLKSECRLDHETEGLSLLKSPELSLTVTLSDQHKPHDQHDLPISFISHG